MDYYYYSVSAKKETSFFVLLSTFRNFAPSNQKQEAMVNYKHGIFSWMVMLLFTMSKRRRGRRGRHLQHHQHHGQCQILLSRHRPAHGRQLHDAARRGRFLLIHQRDGRRNGRHRPR